MLSHAELFWVAFSLGGAICGCISWICRGREIARQLGVLSRISAQSTHEAERFGECTRALEQKITECEKRSLSLEQRLRAAKEFNSQTSREIEKLKSAVDQLKAEKAELVATYGNTLSSIRADCSLLPSVVDWSIRIQEALDNTAVQVLKSKDNPAPKAAIVVSESKAEARLWRRTAEELKNRIALYEAEAPWLVEYLDYSVEDVVDGLRIDEDTRQSYISGNDPAQLYLSVAEWAALPSIERYQLALDRYWSNRQKSAWAAGIMFERYVGYMYESDGFSVTYHGAIKGVRDLGIDLICKKDGYIHLVQCKRLAPEKKIPVRENTVAQIYGSALAYSHFKDFRRDWARPTVVTSYELSVEAKEFASALGVAYKERVRLAPYPCIKCNVSIKGNEKIYHLPFDQQYDTTSIDRTRGERYSFTIAEAEKHGFRRALRWTGS